MNKVFCAFLLSVSLLSVPLLSACVEGGHRQAGETETSGQTKDKDQENPGPDRPGKAPGPSAPDSESPADPGEGDVSYSSLLLDEQGVRIELLEVPDFETGELSCLLRVTNTADSDLFAELKNCRLDNDLLIDADTSLSCDAGTTQVREYNDLRTAVLMAGRYGKAPRSFSCTVTFTHWDASRDNASTSVRFDCSAPLPDSGGRPVFEESLGMRADRQVLTDTSDLLVTLLGCGFVPASYGKPSVQGLFLVENNGRTPAPFMVNGALINGLSMDVYDTGGGMIEPGLSRYVRFSVNSRSLENSGISEISDLSLLLLTDKGDNTGTMSMAGGRWYPVTLAVHADVELTFEEGELLYEDDYVRIGLRDIEATWTQLEYADSYGNCDWFLSVVNKSDRNLEIAISDIEYKDFDPGEHGAYMSDKEIGAGARKYTGIRLLLDEPAQAPAISFRLQVRTAGGGKLLSYPRERILIPGKNEEP